MQTLCGGADFSGMEFLDAFDGEVEDENIKISTKPLKDKYTLTTFTERIIKEDENKEIVAQYLLTTTGRILLNKILFDSLTLST